MTAETCATELNLDSASNERLANLCGPLDGNLRQIEERLNVEIHNRGGNFRITGESATVDLASKVILELYSSSAREPLTADKVHLLLQSSVMSAPTTTGQPDERTTISTRRAVIHARSRNQESYLRNIASHDISFGVGPAGTGKTYLAVACALQALEQDRVRRIVLARPAVEAGEKLGYLPGDIGQKVDPYLRPLYDALYEMLGFESVARYIEKNIIELAPLAFMRGRTLNDSFIILDEAQNTTMEQMKMFLTRIGFGSKAVITGDITQTDLPQGRKSGLRHVASILHNEAGISFTYFTSADVVRHPVVARILDAYERHEGESAPGKPLD